MIKTDLRTILDYTAQSYTELRAASIYIPNSGGGASAHRGRR